MSDEGTFFFTYEEMVYSWDGGCYIYEWFKDSWEATLWYERQENLPRAIENVIENNISPFKSWIVWPYKGDRIIPFEFDAFKDYVINHITKGTAKEAK